MQARGKLVSAWLRMGMCVAAKARTGRRRPRRMHTMSLVMVVVLMIVAVPVTVL